jgi:hypothetical protein
MIGRRWPESVMDKCGTYFCDNPYPCSEKQVSIMANYTPRVGVWKGIYSKAIRCRQNIIKSKPVF